MSIEMEFYSLFSPLILAANLIFFFGSEVILDVESLADFLGRFAFNHIGYSLATHIEKGLDVKIVGGLAIWSATAYEGPACNILLE